MNKLVLALAFASVAAFATEAPESIKPALPMLEIPTGVKDDSLFNAQKALWQKDSANFAAEGQRDSVKFDLEMAKLPDSVKTMIHAKRAVIEARVAAMQTLKREEIKIKLDSLASEHKAHRDSVIAKLPAATQAKIKAHLVEIDARRTGLKTRIVADRAELQARIEAAKAAKAATAAPVTTP